VYVVAYHGSAVHFNEAQFMNRVAFRVRFALGDYQFNGVSLGNPTHDGEELVYLLTSVERRWLLYHSPSLGRLRLAW
jgi:hypothetical protein